MYIFYSPQDGKLQYALNFIMTKVMLEFKLLDHPIQTAFIILFSALIESKIKLKSSHQHFYNITI